MIVLGVETATPQSSVALGSERGLIASVLLAGVAHQEAVVPALQHLLEWSEAELSQVGGVAVGIGPGLFTGLRVGVETAKTLAQVLRVPIVGLNSLDVLAYSVRYTQKLVGAVIDGRRGEVFYATYRTAPGGVMRMSDYAVGTAGRLVGELQAKGNEVLLVGNGALLYRRELEELGSKVEFASATLAHPLASSLVELAIPRFIREEADRLFDVVPLYLRKSDAEIAWDQRARGA